MIKYPIHNLEESYNPLQATYNFPLNKVIYLEDLILFLWLSTLLKQLTARSPVFLVGQQEICKNQQVLKVPIFYRFLFSHILMILLVISQIEFYILLVTFRDTEQQAPSILMHILSLPSLDMSELNHCKALQILSLKTDLYPLHQ